MIRADTSSTYRVYLLTVWQERSRELACGRKWRFRLEDPRSGECRGFASAEELVVALQAGLAYDSIRTDAAEETEEVT